jgi:hypothetical protein
MTKRERVTTRPGQKPDRLDRERVMEDVSKPAEL